MAVFIKDLEVANDEALGCFAKAIDLDPDSPLPLDGRVVLHVAKDKMAG